MFKDDEKLEEENYKRIQYTKREKKERMKKVKSIEREELFDDGIKEIKQIQKFFDRQDKKPQDESNKDLQKYKSMK